MLFKRLPIVPRFLSFQSIGKVQLMFRDERGNRFIVTRSMEARLLKSKMDFKSIDGTLSIQQPDGKVICLTFVFARLATMLILSTVHQPQEQSEGPEPLCQQHPGSLQGPDEQCPLLPPRRFQLVQLRSSHFAAFQISFHVIPFVVRPLDEGKKVKEKFDDIFNTTRYVKCQDDIRKEITEVRSSECEKFSFSDPFRHSLKTLSIQQK